MASAIAQALGLASSALAPLEHVKQALSDKHLMLTLDNVEQLLGDDDPGDRLTVATIVADILAAAPNIKVLTTSREALHINGEHCADVASLAMPDAVELFARRARAIRPAFGLSDDNAPAVADLCARLDRLPLAIELAAADANVLPVETILQKLDQRFSLLRRGARDAPDRHRTLQAAIDWSYDLLSEAEQSLFRRLSVFVGGFTLDALQALWPAVAATETPAATEHHVASLIDKSLIQRVEVDAASARFGQLETIREYGLLKLSTEAEIEAARRDHALHFLALAETAEPMLYGSEQNTWLARLGEEHDNLRAALQWTIRTGETTIAARLGIALWHFWYVRSHHHEGTQWLEQIRAMPVSKEARAKLLYGLGMLARRASSDDLVCTYLTEALDLFYDAEEAYDIASKLRVLGFIDQKRGKIKPAQQKLLEALALFQELGHTEGIAATLSNLAYVQQHKLDWTAARRYQEESLAIRRRIGNRHGMATSLDSLGLIAIHQNDLTSARAFLTESINLYDALGNRESTLVPIDLLGAIAYLEGRFDEACARSEQAYGYAKLRGSQEQLAVIETCLSLATLHTGKRDEAIAYLQRALTFWRTSDNPAHLEHVALGLAAFCLAAFENGRLVAGLRVAGKCARIRIHADRNVLAASVFQELDQAVAVARSMLNGDDATQAYREGEAMLLNDVINLALDECDAFTQGE